ncbi:MAG: hypothetical protein ACJA0C_001527 [Candidatus Endobugula sp.]|jgi:hypothetical protein
MENHHGHIMAIRKVNLGAKLRIGMSIKSEGEEV